MTKPSVHKSHADAKAAGWFSRRYQTNEGLELARAGRAARKAEREKRIVASKAKTEAEKLKKEHGRPDA